MEKKYIGLGLFGGLIAGLASLVFARVFIETHVRIAIEYEEGRSHAESALAGGHGHQHEHELFTRSVQENVGAGIGSVVFAIALGAMFAVAFIVLWSVVSRRYPATDPRWVAAALGGLSFVAVCAVPQFVYPANPPAVGEADTIGSRSASYLTLTLVSVGLMVLAVVAALGLRPRVGGPASAICAGFGYLVGVGVVALFLPRFDEVPHALTDSTGTIVYEGFPAQTLALFRTYSVLNQALMWIVLVVVFAALLRRLSSDTAPLRQRTAVSAL